MTPEQATNISKFIAKMLGLRIHAKILRVEEGPVVTTYYFELGAAVPIAKILSKEEDFALAAGVDTLTITRIGGEIVFFVPNEVRKVIEFKDYLNWYLLDKEVSKMSIPIPLGVDHVGKFSAIDLVELPHLLLAGATGSGKSVYECAILCSISTLRTGRNIRFILVDTKQMDLPLFSSLPHIDRIVTTLHDYFAMMDDLMAEYRTRQQRIIAAGVRNIREYNTLVGPENAMPFIVLLIDEYGDLKLQDDAERKGASDDRKAVPKVNEYMQRLVQVCRAVGIHVILGTQRTSTDIIDGSIKANFQARISLRLPSQIDSRTILDTSGAETLLGKGDMLLLSPNSEKLQRFHGPFVDLSDIAMILAELDNIREMYKGLRERSVVNE